MILIIIYYRIDLHNQYQQPIRSAKQKKWPQNCAHLKDKNTAACAYAINLISIMSEVRLPPSFSESLSKTNSTNARTCVSNL